MTVFKEITNEDIYEELVEYKKCQQKQDTKITVNRWIASTALTLVIGVIIGGLII